MPWPDQVLRSAPVRRSHWLQPPYWSVFRARSRQPHSEALLFHPSEAPRLVEEQNACPTLPAMPGPL
jgi:hypothetical protein